MYEFLFTELLVCKSVKRTEKVGSSELRYFSKRADKALPRNMELSKEILVEAMGMPVRMVGWREPEVGLQLLATLSMS